MALGYLPTGLARCGGVSDCSCTLYPAEWNALKVVEPTIQVLHTLVPM
jgi:hypothetical protein